MKRTIALVALLFFACPRSADMSLIGGHEWDGELFQSPPRAAPLSTKTQLGELRTDKTLEQIWVVIGMGVKVTVRDILLERLDTLTANYYADLILGAAFTEGMQGYEEIMASQVMRESWGTPEAVGGRVCLRRDSQERCLVWDQAVGLGQIMPSVWRDVEACKGDLFDPEINLRCTARVLRYHLEECGWQLLCGLNGYWGSTEYSHEESPYTRSVMAVLDD